MTPAAARAIDRLVPFPPVVSNHVARPRGIWVIYDEPSACAARYVARKFLVGNVFTFVTDDEICAHTLKEIHDLLADLHPGLLNIGRNDADPKSIIETWA